MFDKFVKRPTILLLISAPLALQLNALRLLRLRQWNKMSVLDSFFGLILEFMFNLLAVNVIYA